jgi:hypothetical protein
MTDQERLRETVLAELKRRRALAGKSDRPAEPPPDKPEEVETPDA